MYVASQLLIAITCQRIKLKSNRVKNKERSLKANKNWLTPISCKKLTIKLKRKKRKRKLSSQKLKKEMTVLHVECAWKSRTLRFRINATKIHVTRLVKWSGNKIGFKPSLMRNSEKDSSNSNTNLRNISTRECSKKTWQNASILKRIRIFVAKNTLGGNTKISWKKLSPKCGGGLAILIATGPKLKWYSSMKNHKSVLRIKRNSKRCRLKSRSFSCRCLLI